MSENILVEKDDLSRQNTRELVLFHLTEMMKNSPPECVFALDISVLQSPDIQVWSAWINGSIAGVCALKKLTADHAELKSMRTHPDYLCKGVAQVLLAHIVRDATMYGFKQLSLETGPEETFKAAIALYTKNGFQKGTAFSDYTDGPYNQFYHLSLP
ncbi:GNAT family N-acetyltransferase [Acinetobacter sp. WZC-1]|uniref:GNAT family N-acetyltransferase n=1 Tax=Acinetobacter sp. WZC-1 TaxID=3459034 RepID=UPI00403E3109